MVINPPGKKYTGRGVLHRGLDNLSENALLSGKQAVDAAADFIHVFP